MDVLMSEFVQHAANLIKIYGLHKGGSGSYEEGFCTIGALGEAYRSNRGEYDDMARALTVMADKGCAISDAVSFWNDHPYTTKEMVVAKLEEVAAHFKALGE